MNITTTFSLGQDVYTMEDGRPVITKVSRINVFVSIDKPSDSIDKPDDIYEQLEQYELFGCNGCKFRNEVFASREHLFDALCDKIESLI